MNLKLPNENAVFKRETCKLVDTNKVQMNANWPDLHRPFLSPLVIYPGRKSVLTFALWWETITSQIVSLCAHKHPREAVDGVLEGRSGRSNRWPVRKKMRRMVERGEAVSSESAALQSQLESVLYTLESRSMRIKHPEKEKTRQTGSTSAPSRRGTSSCFFKNHKGDFCKIKVWKDLLKMWEYLKI